MATKKAQDQSDTDTLLNQVLENYAQDDKSHSAFVQKTEDRYKAYRGYLEIKSKAAGWTSKQHPPYIHQVIETEIASMVDPDPRWRVRPRPMMADPQEVQRLQDGAKANEIILSQQADCARFGEKQVLFAKQCMIAGLAVYKTFWDFREEPRQRQAIIHEPVLHPETQEPVGYQSRLGVEDYTGVAADDNAVDVVDVRDFIWHEAAISLEKAKRVTHRILYSMEELRGLERAGLYNNVSKLVDTYDTAPSQSQREQELFEANRAKDLVEVLEQWRRMPDGSIRVTSIGNRAVLLRDKPNPFWHGQFPFVVCSAVPDLFRIPGISEVELIQDLQELLWTMMNQRIDNTHLLNNAIVLIREDADDYEQFEWAPGAQWIVTDPEQVKTLQVDPAPTQMSLEAETRALQDLQNITGASPALLGQIDQSGTTATEVSLTSSLGQRRLAMKKQQFKYCHGRVGEQWLANNQQFIRDDRLVSEIGPGGQHAFRSISPLVLQGDYVIDLEAMDESLVKQQRQAEAQSLFQVAMSAAPIFAALAQAGQVEMLDVKAFMEDVLEAAGISDKQRYFLPAGQQPPQLGNPQQQGGPQGQQGLGVTAPQAADMASPSNAASQSPAAAMQRMLAMGGGPANAPAA